MPNDLCTFTLKLLIFMSLLQQHITEIFVLLFMGITLLQSGIDKVTDWKGNVSFITDHFKNSPLKGQVPLLLVIILVMEILASALMLVGIFHLAMSGVKTYALLGLEISAVTLLFLLIGQRLAKDYPGAMSLGVYFIINIFGIYILNNI